MHWHVVHDWCNHWSFPSSFQVLDSETEDLQSKLASLLENPNYNVLAKRKSYVALSSTPPSPSRVERAQRLAEALTKAVQQSVRNSSSRLSPSISVTKRREVPLTEAPPKRQRIYPAPPPSPALDDGEASSFSMVTDPAKDARDRDTPEEEADNVDRIRGGRSSRPPMSPVSPRQLPYPVPPMPKRRPSDVEHAASALTAIYRRPSPPPLSTDPLLPSHDRGYRSSMYPNVPMDPPNYRMRAEFAPPGRDAYPSQHPASMDPYQNPRYMDPGYPMHPMSNRLPGPRMGMDPRSMDRVRLQRAEDTALNSPLSAEGGSQYPPFPPSQDWKRLAMLEEIYRPLPAPRVPYRMAEEQELRRPPFPREQNCRSPGYFPAEDALDRPDLHGRLPPPAWSRNAPAFPPDYSADPYVHIPRRTFPPAQR